MHPHTFEVHNARWKSKRDDSKLTLDSEIHTELQLCLTVNFPHDSRVTRCSIIQQLNETIEKRGFYYAFSPSCSHSSIIRSRRSSNDQGENHCLIMNFRCSSASHRSRNCLWTIAEITAKRLKAPGKLIEMIAMIMLDFATSLLITDGIIKYELKSTWCGRRALGL